MHDTTSPRFAAIRLQPPTSGTAATPSSLSRICCVAWCLRTGPDLVADIPTFACARPRLSRRHARTASRARWWAGRWLPHLDASLPWQRWISARSASPGPPSLIHHSDRGVNMRRTNYRHSPAPPPAIDITVSMSRPRQSYDNASRDFMKTLKTEEVDGRRLRTSPTQEPFLGVFISFRLQHRRLHSRPRYAHRLNSKPFALA